MDIFQALFLGLLQGLTEFLPISSSAHLILTPAFFGWEDQGVGFDLSVHVGTLLAVVLYFRRDVFGIARDGLISMGQRKIVGQGALAWYLVIGPIPAAMARRKNRYRTQLVVAARGRAKLSTIVTSLVSVAESTRHSYRLKWFVDVDPYESL